MKALLPYSTRSTRCYLLFWEEGDGGWRENPDCKGFRTYVYLVTQRERDLANKFCQSTSRRPLTPLG